MEGTYPIPLDLAEMKAVLERGGGSAEALRFKSAQSEDTLTVSFSTVDQIEPLQPLLFLSKCPKIVRFHRRSDFNLSHTKCTPRKKKIGHGTKETNGERSPHRRRL